MHGILDLLINCFIKQIFFNVYNFTCLKPVYYFIADNTPSAVVKVPTFPLSPFDKTLGLKLPSNPETPPATSAIEPAYVS